MNTTVTMSTTACTLNCTALLAGGDAFRDPAVLLKITVVTTVICGHILWHYLLYCSDIILRSYSTVVIWYCCHSTVVM